jgi:hypothetical protein
MIKLKKLIKESSPGFTKREFGDPLPTFEEVMEKHKEGNGTVKEAAPQIRTKPGEKETQAIINKLEKLKKVDIPSRHASKFKSAIKNAQKSVSKIENIIRMSSTL